MSQTRKVEPRRNELVSSRTVVIHAGKGGYHYFPISIETEGKKNHKIFFKISVIQPAGRQDLDINFFVADSSNFQLWVNALPNRAFLITPRIIFGELHFTPPSSGQYFAVLNNQYSILTQKTVTFASYETWIEEKAPKEVEVKKDETSPEAKVGFFKGLYSRLRYSKTLRLLYLLIVVQIACFLVASVILLLFNLAFGLDYKDTIGYVAASVGSSALVILFALYYFHTGKQLTTPA